MALFTKTVRKHIFVHPAQQNKLHTAVKSTLMKDKRKYSDQLEGALLNVSNLKVVGNHHLLVEGYQSMEVEADFQVFCPSVGMSLEGIVNKISKGHIGCLVMDLFNASIAIPPHSTVNLEVGSTCEFSVTDVIIDADILSLRGSLSSPYYVNEEIIETDEKAELEFDEKAKILSNGIVQKAADDNEALFERGVLTQATPSSKTSPKKKKKKKDEFQPEDEKAELKLDVKAEILSNGIVQKAVHDNEALFDRGVLTQATPSPKTSPKKKKKKKDEFQPEDDLDISVNKDLCESSPKKRRKKADDTTNGIAHFSQTSSPPTHSVTSSGDYSASPSKKSKKASKAVKLET